VETDGITQFLPFLSQENEYWGYRQMRLVPALLKNDEYRTEDMKKERDFYLLLYFYCKNARRIDCIDYIT
jgi:hypothetical protein